MTPWSAGLPTSKDLSENAEIWPIVRVRPNALARCIQRAPHTSRQSLACPAGRGHRSAPAHDPAPHRRRLRRHGGRSPVPALTPWMGPGRGVVGDPPVRRHGGGHGCRKTGAPPRPAHHAAQALHAVPGPRPLAFRRGPARGKRPQVEGSPGRDSNRSPGRHRVGQRRRHPRPCHRPADPRSEDPWACRAGARLHRSPRRRAGPLQGRPVSLAMGGPSPRHRQADRQRSDPEQAEEVERAGVGRHPAPCRRGPHRHASPRVDGSLGERHRAAPRAVWRWRLSGRDRGRGDLTCRTDRGGRRLLRHDDRCPDLQEADGRPGRSRGAGPMLPEPVSTLRWCGRS